MLPQVHTLTAPDHGERVVNSKNFVPILLLLVAEWIHLTLLGDNITHYKTKSVHFLGLMNSATKCCYDVLLRSLA